MKPKRAYKALLEMTHVIMQCLYIVLHVFSLFQYPIHGPVATPLSYIV